MSTSRNLKEFVVDIRFRTNIFGRLIVQVAYRTPANSPGVFELKWRDATAKDFRSLDLKLSGEALPLDEEATSRLHEKGA